MNITYPKTASVTTTAFNFLQSLARQPQTQKPGTLVEEEEAHADSTSASNNSYPLRPRPERCNTSYRPSPHTRLVPTPIQSRRDYHNTLTQRCNQRMNEELFQRHGNYYTALKIRNLQKTVDVKEAGR